jgi:hypothetical protein
VVTLCAVCKARVPVRPILQVVLFCKALGLLCRVEVPAGVQPLALAQDKRLGGSAGLRGGFSARFDLVPILGVHDCGVAVDLRFGVGEFEAL